MTSLPRRSVVFPFPWPKQFGSASSASARLRSFTHSTGERAHGLCRKRYLVYERRNPGSSRVTLGVANKGTLQHVRG